MNDFKKTLAELKEQVRAIEASYNPKDLNLHFHRPARTDSALFEKLYAVGLEAWNIVRVNQSQNTLHWFYDFFLLISSASVKILNDHTQNQYPKAVIEQITLLLVDISQMTNNKEFEGDIRSRNLEALTNLLLAFGNLSSIVRNRAKEMNNQDVNDFVKWAIESVAEYE
jgi:hypothetical protein